MMHSLTTVKCYRVTLAHVCIFSMKYFYFSAVRTDYLEYGLKSYKVYTMCVYSKIILTAEIRIKTSK